MRLTTLAMLAALGVATTLPAAPAAAQTATITGAGATFPSPVYFRWGEAARGAIGIQLNFQPIGSGGGINQITNRTVDFGASDAPVADEQLTASNLVQFPTVMGGIVMIINVPGVADRQMRLTGETIADIYMGRISRWNDRRLAELNPGVALPNLPIAPVFRADASGTTYQFTNYLAQISSDWAQRVGNRTSVRWPAGVGARGNDGVAGAVRNTRGAIGYVEYVFAKSNDLPVTLLRNREGRFVDPSNEALQAAAANADWSSDPNFGISLNNQPGEASWPMTAPTFILVPTDARQPERTANVLRFFDWAFREGGQMALDLTYIPMPPQVVEMVRATWKERLGFSGN